MAKQCEKCKKTLGFRDKKSINYFVDEQEKCLVLCTNCYFDLSKDESYNIFNLWAKDSKRHEKRD